MVEIKAGLAVKLRAKNIHAPLLTVESVADGKAVCVWFHSGELRRQTIATEALETV